MVQNENKQLFLKFLNRKGKKGKIEKIYANLFLNLKQQNKNPHTLFKQSVTLLQPKVQSKKISRFQTTLTPISKTKQTSLALKWLTESFSENQLNKINFLTTEIINTTTKTSKSYQTKLKQYHEIRKLRFTLR